MKFCLFPLLQQYIISLSPLESSNLEIPQAIVPHYKWSHKGIKTIIGYHNIKDNIMIYYFSSSVSGSCKHTQTKQTSKTKIQDN